MSVDRAPLVAPDDDYLKLPPSELERLRARARCLCGDRATVDSDGLCRICGHTRDWSRWLATA